MKLGIVIILIGVAWCVRCYLLRPSLSEPPVAVQQERVGLSFSNNVIVSGNTFTGASVGLGLPDSPEIGETVEFIYWSKEDGPMVINGWNYPGGTKHSRMREVFTFNGQGWTETERYPIREGALPR